MRITIIGTGYAGLVSGACFADAGHEVTCLDSNPAKIDRLNAGHVPIFEPGLEALIAANVAKGRLFFTTSAEQAVPSADMVIITVGTPLCKGTQQANVQDVLQAAESIAAHMQGFTLVVVQSTVPVGTGDAVESILKQQHPNESFCVVANPIFVREGDAVHDFSHPDRVVVGTQNVAAQETMRELYRSILLNEAPVLLTSRRTAELTKYAANAFLAMKVAFINEMADFCEKVGADIAQVGHAIGMDHRIGLEYLQAGPGFGGSCLPKDVQALATATTLHEAPSHILDAVIKANAQRKNTMVEKITDALAGDVKNKLICILGLTFKPNTDDMREAPSLAIIAQLRSLGARIHVYDPQGQLAAKALLSDITYYNDPYDAAKNADAMVVLTEWKEFITLDLARIHALLKQPTIVDLRNIYDPAIMREHGFHYTGVGRT